MVSETDGDTNFRWSVAKQGIQRATNDVADGNFSNRIVIPLPRLPSQRNVAETTPLLQSQNGDSDVREQTVGSFFFGFMCEDQASDEKPVEAGSRLGCNTSICLSIAATAAAASSPMALIPFIFREFDGDETPENKAIFTSHAAAYSVLGAAAGKMLGGPLTDIVGARRVSCVSAILLSFSLVGLSVLGDKASLLWSCFVVEFLQSVQWPCVVVILGTQYAGCRKAMDSTIFRALLSMRVGGLLSVLFTLVLLRRFHWRTVAIQSSSLSMLGAFITGLFVKDSTIRANDPQNPISTATWDRFNTRRRVQTNLTGPLIGLVFSILFENVLPAVAVLLRSGSFWLVSLAHTGDSVVRSSERVLAAYFQDTSYGILSESHATNLAVLVSAGIILGLLITSTEFTRSGPKRRKQVLFRVYLLTITACYGLAFLALPWLHSDNASFVVFRAALVVAMGFGIAIPGSVPGIVGATYGRNKGLFTSYVDGVANGVAAVMWSLVGRTVENGMAAGWAFGWATVALIVILSAVAMIEFIDQFTFSSKPDRTQYVI